MEFHGGMYSINHNEDLLTCHVFNNCRIRSAIFKPYTVSNILTCQQEGVEEERKSVRHRMKNMVMILAVASRREEKRAFKY